MSTRERKILKKVKKAQSIKKKVMQLEKDLSDLNKEIIALLEVNDMKEIATDAGKVVRQKNEPLVWDEKKLAVLLKKKNVISAARKAGIIGKGDSLPDRVLVKVETVRIDNSVIEELLQHKVLNTKDINRVSRIDDTGTPYLRYYWAKES